VEYQSAAGRTQQTRCGDSNSLNNHSVSTSRLKIQMPQKCVRNSPNGVRKQATIKLRAGDDDVVGGVGFAVRAEGAEGIMVLLAFVLIGTVPGINADDAD
jgi:hypothetical protein